MTKTIDITPTWSGLIPIMVEILKNPKANNTAKQEVVTVFDVVNVYEPEDISHVYPQMATDEFMNDVNSAWKKILNILDIAKQN